MTDLLTTFRAHLINEGLVRNPGVAGPLPPAWLDPLKGVPGPGEGTGVQVGATIVVGLSTAGGFPAAPYEAEWKQDRVDIVIRATTSPAAKTLGGEIRRVTLDRWNWRMGDPGGITVMQATEFTPLQPITPRTQWFDFIWGVIFQIRAEDAY